MAEYVVKSVASGDMLVLLQPNKLPPVEKMVMLSHVFTGKLASSRLGQKKDDPYAWEARERVRKLVIGKTVRFINEYIIESSKRECGQVTLGENNLARLLVSEGLAEVRTSAANRSSFSEELFKLQDQAKSAKVGRWGEPKEGREVVFDTETNAASLVAELQGQTVPGIVEFVISPTLLKVTLLRGFKNITLQLTGVRAPANGQPFYNEAKFFVERSLLNRDVSVVVEGIETRQQGDSVFGSLTSAEGPTFQAKLIEKGFAQVNLVSITKTAFSEELLTAEGAAKEKKVGIFKNYDPKAIPQSPVVVGGPSALAADTSAACDQEPYSALVVQVVSGDQIAIRRSEKEPAVRVTLANVRSSRQVAEDGKLVFPRFAWEAREYLREKLVGKVATFKNEFVRKPAPGSTQSEDRVHVSVFLDSVNVVEGLIKEGYATFQRGVDDNNRPTAAILQAAEAAAKESGLRYWSLSDTVTSGGPGTTTFVDLIRPGVKKAKPFLAYFQKGGRVKGIVESVTNASRYRVTVPSQSAVITLSVNGLLTPQTARQDGSGPTANEPYAQESLNFATDKFLNRNVEVEIESVDNIGTFHGSILLDGVDIGCPLLEKGLAVLSPQVVKSKHSTELKKSAAIGKENCAGLFSIDETLRPQPRVRASARGSLVGSDSTDFKLRNSNGFSAYVVDITANLVLCTQSDSQSSQLEEIEALIKKNPRRAEGNSAVNDMVLALYDRDGSTYRAKVLYKFDDGRRRVLFIDYGNTETVAGSDVFTITEEKLKTTPGLVSYYTLAFLEMPTAPELVTAAGKEMHVFTADGVEVKPLFADGNSAYAMVSVEENTLQSELLSKGLAKLSNHFPNNTSFTPIVESLSQVESTARLARVGLWASVDDDDDEEYY